MPLLHSEGYSLLDRDHWFSHLSVLRIMQSSQALSCVLRVGVRAFRMPAKRFIVELLLRSLLRSEAGAH